MSRTMYDSVDPMAIPRDAQMVAGYIDGTTYRWPETAWDRFPNAVKVRIARRVSTNDGHVLDVEAGIPTVWPPTSAIVRWVQMRRNSGVEPTIYCNQLNDWAGIRALFVEAEVREPQWWVARYDGRTTIPSGAVAKQYANPPIAGGHYDLSAVRDYWPGVDDMSFSVDEKNLVMAWLEDSMRRIQQIHRNGGAYLEPDTVPHWGEGGDYTKMWASLDSQLKLTEELVEVREEVAHLTAAVQRIEALIADATGAGLRLTATGDLRVGLEPRD